MNGDVRQAEVGHSVATRPSMSTLDRLLEGFGPRLAAIRQAQGLTQAELGDAAHVSQRVIAYYETESTQPVAR